jgi:hypothetical protein
MDAFERSDVLHARRAELSAVTLELRWLPKARKPNKTTFAAEHGMKMRSRTRMESVAHPSPSVLEQHGCNGADVSRRIVEARERMALGDCYLDLNDGSPDRELDL